MGRRHPPANVLKPQFKKINHAINVIKEINRLTALVKSKEIFMQ